MVTLPFLLIAAAMVLVALACMLVPMLRTARRRGRPRAPFVLALVIAVATPPVVLALYLAIGTPQALHAAEAAPQLDLARATAGLKARLEAKPDDVQGWALLAQAYSALNEPQEAMSALDRLLKLKPDDADALVAWVEAAAATRPDHLIDDASRARLQQALQINPTHQRALWLLGISDYQRGRYADAANRWRTLLPLLQPGSRVAATVQHELEDAESRSAAPGPSAPTATADQALPTAPVNAVALNVTVKLAPTLADKLRPGDALYVFARAVDGPAMPVAVARLHPSRIPVQVTLTDKMAINPALELSKFARVQVAARISRSGSATPEPGDLESTPVEVATSTRTPIALTIDKVD